MHLRDHRFGMSRQRSAHPHVHLDLPCQPLIGTFIGVIPMQRGHVVVEGVEVAFGVPMSWPAEKCLPLARSTMTFTDASSTALPNAASNEYVITEFWALRYSGRFSVT